jgi:hypothetical protein
MWWWQNTGWNAFRLLVVIEAVWLVLVFAVVVLPDAMRSHIRRAAPVRLVPPAHRAHDGRSHRAA